MGPDSRSLLLRVHLLIGLLEGTYSEEGVKAQLLVIQLADPKSWEFAPNRRPTIRPLLSSRSRDVRLEFTSQQNHSAVASKSLAIGNQIAQFGALRDRTANWRR